MSLYIIADHVPTKRFWNPTASWPFPPEIHESQGQKGEIPMRYIATMIFLVLFAATVTLVAVSHFIDSMAEMPTQYPTGPEWQEHRQQAEELEKKMQQCKDPEELEKLHRQHFKLTERWKTRIKPLSQKGSEP
jgi:hypothetical protein